MTNAVGYIRQSRRADLDVALSPEQQRQDIEALARRDGLTVTTIFEDLGRSGGRGKERHRVGYQDMVDAIAAGGVGVVYTKTLTRLGRSVTELYRVLQIAESVGCRIVTMKEGPMDPTTPIGRAQFGMLAVFAEFERDLAVERAKDNVATRRARGERMGRVPYGERPGDRPDAILVAWEESGHSLNGTALLLNRRRVPTWQGERVRDGQTEAVEWTGPAVRLVLARLVPGLIPERAKRGVKPTSPFLLYRLLRCPCGRIMTASRDGRGNREPVYRCHAADTLPDHPRPYRVRESAVLPWVMAEAGRFRIPADAVERDAANDAERARQEAKRARIIDTYTDGAIDKAERDRRLEAVDDALGRITQQQQIVAIPQTIDWASWSPEAINRVLSALWHDVALGPDLRPIRADWVVPEWRAE